MTSRRALLCSAVLIASLVACGIITVARPTQRLNLLNQGQFDALAADVVRTSSDELVGALDAGLAWYLAGQPDSSNRAFDRAERLIGERFTRSMTREAARALVTEASAAYQAKIHEAAYVHYYRLLNYLHAGRTADAVVEARRTMQTLGVLADERQPEAGQLPDGLLRYLSGLVFVDAGERNDAFVALRDAERAFGGVRAEATVVTGLDAELGVVARALGTEDLLDVGPRPPRAGRPGDGELVIMLELGTIAQRRERAIAVPVYQSEWLALRSDSLVERDKAGKLISDRAIEAFSGRGTAQRRAETIATHLQISFPEIIHRPVASSTLDLRVGGRRVTAVEVADLSRAAERTLETEMAGATRRAVVRALVRVAAVSEAQAFGQRMEEADTTGGRAGLGQLLGQVAMAFGNSLEMADVRSWHLLPDRIFMARVPLPPGDHTISIVAAGQPATVLGRFTVRAGQRIYVSARRTGRWHLVGPRPAAAATVVPAKRDR